MVKVSAYLSGTVWVLLAHFLVVATEPFIGADGNGLEVNSRWYCDGCRNDNHAISVFSQIHLAVRYGERLSYLPLDMSWIDQLNQIDTTVDIIFKDFRDINDVATDAALAMKRAFKIPVAESPSGLARTNSKQPRVSDEDKSKMRSSSISAHRRLDVAESGNQNQNQNQNQFVDRKRSRRHGGRSSSAIQSQSVLSEGEAGDGMSAGAGSNNPPNNQYPSNQSTTISGQQQQQDAGQPNVVPSLLNGYSDRIKVLAFHFDHSPLNSREAMREYQKAVDGFLAINPCWLPLQEPAPVPFYLANPNPSMGVKYSTSGLGPALQSATNLRGRASSSSSSSGTSSSGGSGSSGSAATSPKRSSQTQGRTPITSTSRSLAEVAANHPNPSEPATATATPTASTPLLLLIRMPPKPMGATCQLYTAVVHRQFPQRCDFKNETGSGVAIYRLANIGFGHTSMFLNNAFAWLVSHDRFRTRSVFAAPEAQEFLSRINKTAVAVLGLKNNFTLALNGLWVWADPNRCEESVYLNNPW
jgi:hypothetical protein